MAQTLLEMSMPMPRAARAPASSTPVQVSERIAKCIAVRIPSARPRKPVMAVPVRSGHRLGELRQTAEGLTIPQLRDEGDSIPKLRVFLLVFG
jgi:hypothetical protein